MWTKSIVTAIAVLLVGCLSKENSSETQGLLGKNKKHYKEKSDTSVEAKKYAQRLNSYTYQTNLMLTNKYGKNFSSHVYKHWLLKQKRNISTRATYIKNLRATQKDFQDSLARLEKRTASNAIMINMGLAWKNDPAQEDDQYVLDFLGEIKLGNANIENIVRDEMAWLHINRTTVREAILKRLRSGQNVVAMGISKGTPEILGAVSDAQSTIERENCQSCGKIIGFINISGMMHGSYLAEYNFINRLAKYEDTMQKFKPLRKYARFPDAFKSFGREQTERFVAGYKSSIPQDIPYLNVVNIVPGNGIPASEESVIRPFHVADKRWNLVKGAHDGMVEYPQNEIGSDLAPRHYEIVTDASHLWDDGHTEGMILNNSHNRRVYYVSLFHTILDLAEVR